MLSTSPQHFFNLLLVILGFLLSILVDCLLMVENQYLNDYLKNDDVYEGDVFLPREYAMKDWLFA